MNKGDRRYQRHRSDVSGVRRWEKSGCKVAFLKTRDERIAEVLGMSPDEVRERRRILKEQERYLRGRGIG